LSGIFSGMKSPSIPSGQEVLADLGDEFIRMFVDAVEGARADPAEFRVWQPEWFVNFSSRFTAGFLHERIWDRLIRQTGGLPGVHVVDQEPTRQLYHGTKCVIRIKRHQVGDAIATYPTDAAVEFWSNHAPTLAGLESYSLALGYRWDPDQRAMGEAVMSFRDSVSHVIWALELASASGPVGFTWSPIEPSLPEIDLGFIAERGDAVGS